MASDSLEQLDEYDNRTYREIRELISTRLPGGDKDSPYYKAWGLLGSASHLIERLVVTIDGLEARNFVLEHVEEAASGALDAYNKREWITPEDLELVFADLSAALGEANNSDVLPDPEWKTNSGLAGVLRVASNIIPIYNGGPLLRSAADRIEQFETEMQELIDDRTRYRQALRYIAKMDGCMSGNPACDPGDEPCHICAAKSALSKVDE